MKKARIEKILLILCLILAWTFASAKEEPKNVKRVAKTSLQFNHTYFLINNIFTQFANTMESDVELTSGQNSGFEWPKGSGKTASYESGFVYAGFYEGKPTPASAAAHRQFVNGSVYISGMTEGWINTYGTGTEPPNASAVLPTDPLARVFRVRPDISPYDTQNDVPTLKDKLQLEEVGLIQRFTAASATSLYNQYVKDWNEWPASQGAPFKDVNGNGTYEPATDIPGVPGADQTLWFVCNDMNATNAQNLAGAGAQGIEIQKTIWGYNRQSALGNVYFAKWTFINKSGANIDTMYNSFWTDIDLGFAGDDFCGVDVKRQLGYNYNGKGFDQVYGDACPASGYAFFQGPLIASVPGDSGIFKGAYRHGFTNLKMSSFDMFINQAGPYVDPPQGNSTAARDQWWNLLTGHIGPSGAAWINPTTGDTTTFVLDGDPVAGTGWLDGSFASPGDRRFCETVGPYDLAAGDTQEIVVAGLVGQGADRLSSVTALRATCDEAQAAYNLFFVLPKSCPSPTVTVTPLDGAIMLSWGDPAKVKAIETDYDVDPESKGYKFEAYRVYQTQTQSFNNAKTIATYDIATDAVLDNNGVQRYILITTDAFKSTVLSNGTPYYFGVSTISYNPAGFPILLEQAPSVFQVIPQQPKLGTSLTTAVNQVITDTSAIKILGGATDGSVQMRVIDPTQVTGHIYSINFSVVGGSKVWSLYDSTTQTVRATGVKKFADAVDDLIVDGIQWIVLDPGVAGGIKNVKVTVDPANPTLVPYNIVRTVSPDGKWSLTGAGSTSTATAYSRINWQSSMGSNDYELRVTGTFGGNTAGQGSLYYIAGGGLIAGGSTTGLTRIPVEVWNVTTNTRLLINMLNDGAVDNTYNASTWAAIGGGNPATYNAASIPYERFYCSSAAPYAEPLPNVTEASGATSLFGRVTFVDNLGTGYFPPVGTVIKFTNNKPITPGVTTFVVNTANYAPVVGNMTLAKTQASQINVFPNPYFGFQPLETTRYTRFVTFSHLPQKATIRIFTLSGQMVRSFSKDDPSQFFQWDLKNGVGIPVASGVYVVHIDLPDVGTTKILKLSVIQPQQILDHL